jgi:hypothetical protein
MQVGDGVPMMTRGAGSMIKCCMCSDRKVYVCQGSGDTRHRGTEKRSKMEHFCIGDIDALYTSSRVSFLVADAGANLRQCTVNAKRHWPRRSACNSTTRPCLECWFLSLLV